jgi:crotonobetainyl-CoA:carnitine CoA-transferase CaiB-like acyl-CoA transferase
MAMALEGIKVIDVSQVVAVPIAARHLADFGAEVIHIEHPVRGDFWRSYQSGVGGFTSVASDVNYNWESLNRNKRSLSLDLSSKKGQEIIYKLLEKADVFVTNLRLWEQEKYGLQYEVLKKINPRLIHGTVTGYGKKGPDKNAPAFDVTAAWYRAGIHYMLSPIAGAGFRSGFVDSVAGVSLFAGVMTALYVRDRTGVGQEVELSLFNTGIYQLTYDMSGALVTGRDFKDPVPGAIIDEALQKRREALEAQAQKAIAELVQFNNEQVMNPLSLTYVTKDARIISLTVLQPDLYWSRVCRALGRQDIEHDPRFVSHERRLENHAALYHIVRDAIATKTLAEWKVILNQEAIPFAPQQKLSEVINDPQARANDYFVPFDHPTYGRIEVLANHIRMSETTATIRLPAPEFSQHTEEILLELGYDWEDIAQLKQQGIIA